MHRAKVIIGMAQSNIFCTSKGSVHKTYYTRYQYQIKNGRSPIRAHRPSSQKEHTQ